MRALVTGGAGFIGSHLCRRLLAGGWTVTWDVKNEDGDRVASGVYIYQIKNSFSEKRGKLVIIR